MDPFFIISFASELYPLTLQQFQTLGCSLASIRFELLLNIVWSIIKKRFDGVLLNDERPKEHFAFEPHI